MTLSKSDFIIGVVGTIFLVLCFLVFLNSNGVSKEFIYQETKECNKLYDTVQDSLNSDMKKCEDDACKDGVTAYCLFNLCDKEFKKDIKEIFYSPILNECAVAYSGPVPFVNGRYHSGYYIKGLTSNNIYTYERLQMTDNERSEDGKGPRIAFINGEGHPEFGYYDLDYVWKVSIDYYKGMISGLKYKWELFKYKM